MASQAHPQENAPTAPAGTAISQPSQGSESILNTSPQDHVSATGENPRIGVSINDPVASKPAGETQPLASPSADGPSSSSIAASETQAPVEAFKAESEAKAAAESGEKRDIDSVAASDAAANPESQSKPAPEQLEQPDTKKQKTDQEPGKELEETFPATARSDTNGEPKKAGRPKKDKAKETVKKAIPTDGIGSRTRSRTKPT